MNKRGFTLVELLAVILIIALLASLVLPQVLNQFSNNSDELTERQIEMIEEAGAAYIDLNNSKYEGKTTVCIELEELVNAGMLNEGFVLKTLGNDYNTQKRLKVTYKNDGKYYEIKLVNSSEC